MRPPIRETARAFGVVFGPSVLLDTAAGAALASSARALHRHRRPAGAVALATGLIGAYLTVGRPLMLHWGATCEDLHADHAAHSTRAVTIEAPPEAVWPWLAQIGQDRAGFYSYEWLENLAGCEMHNAHAVHAEWQRREPGETVCLHPLRGLPVARFEPGHVLVLEGWGAFVLEPHGPGCTRLIARGPAPRGIGAVTNALLMEIPHFLMERKMLLGIKERAEQAHTVAVRRALQRAPVAEAAHV
jgi:hypothetical protein